MIFSPSNLKRNILPVVFLSVVMIFLFSLNIVSAATYEDIFTSGVIDNHHTNVDYGTISWDATVPTPTTSLVFEVRAGNATNTSDASWNTGWNVIASSGDAIQSGLDNHRYFQYRITLGTDDLSVTPVVRSVSFERNTSALISSVYHTDDLRSSLENLYWDEDLDGGEIFFQVRTSPDGINNWTNWCGPDNGGSGCDTESFFTDYTGLSENMDDIFRDNINDRYFQYKTILLSDVVNGGARPFIYEVNFEYDISTSTPRIYEDVFTSQVIDNHAPTEYGIITWNMYVPANTSIRNIQARAGNDIDTSDPSWTAWTDINNGQVLNAPFDGNRYFQYHLTLGTDDLAKTPIFYDIKYERNISALISSPYDTNDSKDALQDLRWVESLTGAGDDVLFQVRTSVGPITPSSWSNWCGPDNGGASCDTESFFTLENGAEAIDDMFRDTNNDQNIQYKVILLSEAPVISSNVPEVSQVDLYYENPPYATRKYEDNFTKIIDNHYPSDFGTTTWNANIPPDTSLRPYVRSLERQVLYEKDFNDGNLSNWVIDSSDGCSSSGIQSSAVCEGDSPAICPSPSGSYFVEASGDDVARSPSILNLANYKDLLLEVKLASESLDDTKNTLLEIYDGSAWQPLESIHNVPMIGNVPAVGIGMNSYTFNIDDYKSNNIQIRISNTGDNDCDDHAFIDDIKISGLATTSDWIGFWEGDHTYIENMQDYEGTWSASNFDALDGSRYLEYKIVLGTDDLSRTPTFYDINFTRDVSVSYSSVYDTDHEYNVLEDLTWTQNLNGGEVAFQLRTSPDNSNWTEWLGPEDGSAISQKDSFYQNPSGSDIFRMLSDHSDDRYFQYKTILKPDYLGSPTTPQVSQVDVSYGPANYMPRDYESTFTSRVMDANYPADFGIMTWEATIPDKTSIRQFEVRAGNVSSPDSSWTDWRWVTNGQDLSIFDGNRYIQYHVILGTDDLSVTPSLDKVSFEINVSALISSPFDTQDIRAGIVNLDWNEQLNGGDVVFQVRTSPDNSNWTPWCGPEAVGEDSTSTCETEKFYSNPTATQSIDEMFLDTVDDQYVQYKAVLMADSVGGSQIPSISQVDFDYDVPENIERAYESIFTSRIFDTHYYNPDFGNINWERDIPANTSLSLQVRSGSTSDASLWTSAWQDVSNGDSLDFCDGSRYIQYRATLGTDDLSITPSLDKVVINSNVSTIVSSVYDSDDSNNMVDDLRWDETQNASSDDVLLQIRTSPDGINWTPWCGPEPVSENTPEVCDIYSFYTDPLGSEKEETMFRSGTDDQYMQYRIMLIADSILGANLPSVSSTTLQYDVPDNSPRLYESTFTSRIFDAHHPADFGIISWINQIPPNTSVRNFQVRAGNVSAVDGTWTSWQDVTNWGSLDSFDLNRYIQYRAILGTDDLSRTPTLDRVRINTNVSAIISSPFNSDDSRNMVKDLTWVEDRPGSSSVYFQIRTSPDASNPTAWSNWCGPDNGGVDCDTESFFTNASATKTIDAMFYDYTGDQYMQYKAILMSNEVGGGDLPSVATTSLMYEPPLRSPRDYESTFTSRIFDLGNPFDLGGIYWNETVPADTSIRIFARFGTGLNAGAITWNNGGAYEYIHDWEEIPSSEIEFGNDLLGVVIPEEYDGSRFVQYQVILGTDDLSKTPSFDKFLIEYFGGHLTSSVYSASPSQNDQMAITGLSWEENWDEAKLGDKIKLNLRTASIDSLIGGSAWIGVATSTFSVGSNCSVATSGSNQIITCDMSHIDQTLRDNNLDNVMQYRIDFIVSEDTSLGRASTTFPNFHEINIDYVKNSPPEFGAVTSSQETIFNDRPGEVRIQYEIRDDDYDPGTDDTFIGIGFQYSLNGGAWVDLADENLTYATTSLFGALEDSNSDGFIDRIKVDESNYEDYITYWNAKEQIGAIYATGSDIRVRIIADDGEAMFNISTSTAMSFDLDTKDPNYSGNPISLSGINPGTDHTTATVTLTSFIDDSALFRKIGFNQELLKNDPGFTWGDQFSGSGTSTTIQLQTNPDIVYARVVDLYNNGVPIFGIASDHNVEGYAYDALLSGNSFANFSCYYNTFDNCTPTSTFGVNIDRYTMNLSGFAYTSDGWISFESSSAPPDNYAFNIDCLDEYTCDGSSVPPCTACYNPQDGNIYGWARLNGDWIKLRGSILGNSANVLINRNTSEFEGLARSTSSPRIDHLYFNCLSEPGGCGPSSANDPFGNDYKVILVNQDPPIIDSLTTRIASSSDLCRNILDALNVGLEWEISDSDPLERSVAYEVEVSNTTPSVIASISGTTSPSAANMGGSIALSGSQLDYDSDYSWRVRARGSFGLWSTWVNFDYSLPNHDIYNYGLITDSDGDPTTFTTYLHEFPEPYFRWVPEEINQNTPIFFTATSSNIFADINGNRATPLPFSTSTYDSLLWDTNDYSRVNIYSTTTPTTTIKFKFTSSTPVNVILTIIDHDHYTCSTSSDFNINVLPDWIEIKTKD